MMAVRLFWKKFLNRVRWNHLYFILVITNVLIISFMVTQTWSLDAINNKLASNHDQHLLAVRKWDEVQQAIHAATAPGNDIFESKDLNQERQNFKKASEHYKKSFSNFQNALENLVVFDTDTKQFDEVKTKVEDIIFTSNQIFEKYEKQDLSSAASLMAQMDRKHLELEHIYENIEKLILDDFKTRQLTLGRRSNELRQQGNLYAFLALLPIATLIFVGFTLSKKDKISKAIHGRNKDILAAIDQLAIVAFTDKKGTLTQVNDNFCKISGYTREELIGKNHNIVNSGMHSKDFFKNLWSTISSGKTWTGEITNKNKNGEHYIVRSVLTPLKNESGKIVEYMAVRFDISESKANEKRLQEAQTMAKIGSWKYDLLTGHQIWSTEHYKIFEIAEPQPQDILYQLYRQRIHPDDLPLLDQYIERAARFGEDFIYNHRVYLDNGSRIKYVQGIGRVTKNSSGKPLYVAGTCQDLTNIISLQEQNKIISNALEQERLKSIHAAKLASLGELSAGVAHEINNPLAIILGNIGLISKFIDDPEKLLSKVDIIGQSAKRIEKIVKGLKRFSRTSDKPTHRVESLSNILNNALNIIEVKLNNSSAQLTMEIDRELNIACDPLGLEQVFINLISNAIDAAEGGETPWIKIMAHEESNNIVVQVIDSGKGISTEIEDKIFNPFFTTKEVGKGTGLGLSVSKGILDEHKATISINRNCPNTCFEVRFIKAVQTKATEGNNAA